jgi:phosphatidate cytidylyltransferase
MKTRILSAIVGFAILAPLLYFSNTYAFSVAISIACVIAVYEMLKCVGIQKLISVALPLYIIAAVTPIAAHYYRASVEKFPAIAMMVFFCLLIYYFANIVFRHNPPLSNIITGVVSVLYTLSGFTTLILLRDDEGGEWILILVFIAAWITDIFAYFCGVLFGRNKLIPHVSPKKTIEGSIGGIVFCTLSFALYGLLVSRFTDYSANYILMIMCGIILSVVSQIGDLIMSVIKRYYNIKDYGKLIPGHGGVLDRFDSIIAVSLVLYVILQASKIFFDINLF